MNNETAKLTADEFALSQIKDHRDDLLDAEIVLMQIHKREYFREMEEAESRIITEALVAQALTRLNKVSDWMEGLQDKAEAAQ